MSNNQGNGNAAAMRDVLGMVLRYLQWLYAQGCTDRGRLSDEIDRVVSAINEPPRNCDVGTAEEQAERYGRYCDKFTGDGMHCETCPCCGKIPFGKCEFAWAQIPYDREDENGQE